MDDNPTLAIFQNQLTEWASSPGQQADHDEARGGHPGGAGHLFRLPRDRPHHRLHVPQVPQREEKEKDSGRRIQVING